MMNMTLDMTMATMMVMMMVTTMPLTIIIDETETIPREEIVSITITTHMTFTPPTPMEISMTHGLTTDGITGVHTETEASM